MAVRGASRELGFDIASTEIGPLRRGSACWSSSVLTAAAGHRHLQPEERTLQATAGAWLARLPQEDFCQATGVTYEQKYEPTAALGSPQSSKSSRVRSERVRTVEPSRSPNFAFWLLAAIDGHAKNFSIYHHRGGAYA